MTQTLSEKLASTPEGMALYQQERLILEVTELICAVMEEKQVSKSELAARLKKSKAFVTQLLDGRANMTLRTISDVLTALGASLHVCAHGLSLSHHEPEASILERRQEKRSDSTTQVLPESVPAFSPPDRRGQHPIANIKFEQ